MGYGVRVLGLGVLEWGKRSVSSCLFYHNWGKRRRSGAGSRTRFVSFSTDQLGLRVCMVLGCRVLGCQVVRVLRRGCVYLKSLWLGIELEW
jgi:hypothetical protein